MKKLFLSVLLSAFLIAGCKQKADEPTFKQVPTATADQNTQAVPVIKSNAPADPAKLVSSWSGMFGPNKITVIVDEVKGGAVKGRSVVAGNDRPFTGTVSQDSEGCHFELKEPGDNQYDGAYAFVTNCDEPTRIDGQWNPFKRGLAAKSFKLNQRTFRYDPNAGDYAIASKQIMKEDQMTEYDPETLRIMRNEIYARHGYNFKTKDMRAYFDNQDWYMPFNHDVRGLLTPIEKKNEAFIKHFEKYAAEYYDGYGR